MCFAGILLLGFPVPLLSDTVMWQNVPLELAFIHARDWLIKMLLMSVIPWMIRKAEAESRSAGQKQPAGQALDANRYGVAGTRIGAGPSARGISTAAPGLRSRRRMADRR